MIHSYSRMNYSSVKYFHAMQRSNPSRKVLDVATASFGIRNFSETTKAKYNEKSNHIFSVQPTGGTEALGMENFRETFTLSPHLHFNIERINVLDSRSSHFLSIQNSAYFKFASHLRKDPLILPKIYMALKFLTGPDDGNYDDFKGSFNFTFALEVTKNKNICKYIYSLCHYRSYINFNLWQLVPKTDPRNPQIMHQPTEECFSDEDICAFSNAFCEYLLKAQFTPQPFVKTSVSNCITFGFQNGEYFYKQYEIFEDYEEALKKLCPSNE